MGRTEILIMVKTHIQFMQMNLENCKEFKNLKHLKSTYQRILLIHFCAMIGKNTLIKMKCLP